MCCIELKSLKRIRGGKKKKRKPEKKPKPEAEQKPKQGFFKTLGALYKQGAGALERVDNMW